jgi:hypothetical protein
MLWEVDILITSTSDYIVKIFNDIYMIALASFFLLFN